MRKITILISFILLLLSIVLAHKAFSLINVPIDGDGIGISLLGFEISDRCTNPYKVVRTLIVISTTLSIFSYAIISFRHIKSSGCLSHKDSTWL
jgi:hypothetical protein